MSERVRAAVGQVGLAVALGAGVGLACAVVLTVVNAVAGRDSPAGAPSGGVVVLVALVAVVYGGIAGALVGVAAAVLLLERAGVASWRQVAFVVVACVIAVVAVGGLAVLLELGWLVVVPAVLCVPALILYLRRYTP